MRKGAVGEGAREGGLGLRRRDTGSGWTFLLPPFSQSQGVGGVRGGSGGDNHGIFLLSSGTHPGTSTSSLSPQPLLLYSMSLHPQGDSVLFFL